MHPDAMRPFGAALRAYFEGHAGAQLILLSGDGEEIPLPAAWFFRGPAEFSAIEKAAIERCRGRVLDVGAGTGLHTLVLQENGVRATAIDINPQAVDIMTCRGIRDAFCADIFDYQGRDFDTLFLIGHGIGIVETIAGLESFLGYAHGLVSPEGQILLESLDVRRTSNPRHLAFQEANRRAGRYIGETRLQIEYAGDRGPWCGWLHVDPETLADHAARSGWKCEPILQLESGDYLARLAH